jgi:DNA-binding GntR family transcriptional regulator
MDQSSGQRWPAVNAGCAAFFDALLDGRLSLGQTLTLDELCTVLGMSLSPVREAVTLLEAEGMITVRRRIGVTIFYPDVAFVRGIFQFRGMIEREAIRKISKDTDLSWLDGLAARHRRVIANVASASSWREYEHPVLQLERELHYGIVATFDNPLISETHAHLLRRMYLLRILNWDAVGPIRTRQSLEEHLEIIDSLDDPERAVAALDRHLQGVLHRLIAT